MVKAEIGRVKSEIWMDVGQHNTLVPKMTVQEFNAVCLESSIGMITNDNLTLSLCVHLFFPVDQELYSISTKHTTHS